MRDWKRIIFKVAATCSCIVFIGISIAFFAETTYAQGFEAEQEQGKHSFIVDEALDQIEKDLGSATGDDKSSTGFEAVDIVELELNIGDLEESGSLKEAPGVQEKELEEALETRAVELETKTFKLEHVKAYNILGSIKEILTEDTGKVQFGEQANSIVVTDMPAKVREINGLIKKLDRTNRDVLFETRVLQIVLNDEYPAGVDWEAIVSDYQWLAFPGFAVELDGKGDKRLSLGTVSQEDYGILVEALDTVGAVRTISKENVRAENGTAKTLSVLPSLARDAYQDNLVLDASEAPKGASPSTERWKSKEVQFHLIPTIKHDKTVTVSVTPELIRGSAGSLLTVPEPEEKKVSGLSLQGAMIQVEDGATVVIGSLFEEVVTESAWKIPLLGDLPLLGAVFRNQEEELRKAEIIAFLTVKSVEKEKVSFTR